MCGIFAYQGPRTDAAAIVLAGLKRLEYRGYDSWGLAACHDDGLSIAKQVGKIGGVVEADGLDPSHVALGHTRWATHGGVTQINAHPHRSCDGSIAVIHNGIVENSQELKAELQAAGHQFTSETDTESIAHLIEDALAAHPLAEATRLAFLRLRGRNAVVAIAATTGEIVVAKNGSPIVLGIGGD